MSAVEGATSLEIGRRLGMPASTVRDILSGKSQRWAALRTESEYLRYAAEAKRQLQLSYSELAKASLEHAEKQLPHASYAQAVMGAAIATDKVLRLNNEVPPDLFLPPQRTQIETLDKLAAMLSHSLIERQEELPSR